MSSTCYLPWIAFKEWMLSETRVSTLVLSVVAHLITLSGGWTTRTRTRRQLWCDSTTRCDGQVGQDGPKKL